MADGAIFECPATPERIDQCPATPERLLSVKSPESSASVSSENMCAAAAGRQTKSPPPNCAICLGKCKDKCFTDTCQHLFCFKCLQEWSKVKAECPLCKKTFKIIIHNARGEDHYEEYLVPPPIISITESIPTLTPRESYFSPFTSSASRRGYSTYPHRFDVFLSDLPRFSDNEIFRNGFSATVQVHPSDNDALQSLFLQRAAIMSRIRQHPFSNEVVHSGSMGQIWRRFIYEKKLYALPVVDITGRFRECSARFYRDNPAQTHRLMPWLNRDLVCLLRDTEHHVSYVLNILSDLLTVYNITSPEFRRRCQPYLGRRTSHFIHEFVNFARSPYDMIGYDREVRYAPYYEEVILSSSDLSDSSESEERRRRRRHRRTEFTFANRSDFSRFFLTGTFGGFSALSDFDIDITSQSGPINLTLESNEGTVADYNQPQVLGQDSVIQIDRDIVLSSTSSDECEFIMEQKPPHLRTPEMVTLNSDSDSDVVFVSESKTSKSPAVAPANKDATKSRKRKLSTIKHMSGSSLPSSESDVDYCGVANDTTVHKEEKPNTNRTSPVVINEIPKTRRRKSVIKQKRKDIESSPPTSDSDDEFCDASNDRKVQKVEENGEENRITEIKSETNAGASTSSGIGSAESRSANVKKYYARPVRRARKSRRNMKSIFEDSSSETESSCSSYDSSSESDSDSSWSDGRSRHKRRRKSKHSKRRKSDSKSKKRKSKKSKKKSRKSKRCRKQRSKKYIFSSSESSPSPTPPPRDLDEDKLNNHP